MTQVRWKLLGFERFRTAVSWSLPGRWRSWHWWALRAGVVHRGAASSGDQVEVRAGATYSRLVSLMVRQALVPAILGIVAGTAGALAASRLLAALLFEVAPTDPASFGAAIGLFLCAAVIAALVPALRSVCVDPAVALRHD